MKNVIFDFDGTIADSLPVAVNIFNGWAKHRKPIDSLELDKLRTLPLSKVIEELRIPPWRVPFLLFRARNEMTKRISDIPIFPGMGETIKSLDSAGLGLYIVSSNGNKNIKKFLNEKNLAKYFRKIYGGIGLLGKSRALEKVLRNNKLDIADTYYIGDEARDIHSAKTAKLHSVSVTWGYNNENILKLNEPEYLIDKPEDLIKILLG
jgi:phosphoglycolate phosphatase-like HAD superfamily hydrolase